jgi:sporulation protein YhbH
LIYNIKRDHSRFRQIVKGKIKQDLKKYVTHGEMIGRKGKDTVTIPVPQIEIPRFRFGDKEQGGTGQGDGKPGDPVGGQPGDQQQEGEGQAGNQAGNHMLEVDLTLQELAEILGEQLELPKIEPRGHKTVRAKTDKYTGIANVGPNSLRHFKRTFKETLKRQISTGTYNPENPIIIPTRKDMKYRSWKSDVRHENSAVIIYMMDVSGSMGDEQKEIVRTEAFWIDTWLRSQYKGIETRYIIHDATAREVDEQTFFRTRESGGTLISSAYKLCQKVIETDYPPSDWNIYPFHFSDGDNWSGEDTRLCMEILEQNLIPNSNAFCYGQVESRYGSGQFYKDLKEHFGAEHESVILSKIENKEGILQSIKDFLGKGK